MTNYNMRFAYLSYVSHSLVQGPVSIATLAFDKIPFWLSAPRRIKNGFQTDERC